MTPTYHRSRFGLAVALAASITPLLAAEPPVRIAPPSSPAPPVATPYVIAPYESSSERTAAAADTCLEDSSPAAGFPSSAHRQPAVAPSAVSDSLCPACNIHPEPAFGTSYNAIMRRKSPRAKPR